MRGEDLRQQKLRLAPQETPPHAWGRRYPQPDLVSIIGNTPTCVGKTKAGGRTGRPAWKHPHMRGEDPIRFPVRLKDSRNTPTCVGKTAMPSRACSPAWKHPHMRGEDSQVFFHQQRLGETPPHAWGRRLLCQGSADHHGNTPTCVGKTDNL